MSYKLDLHTHSTGSPDGGLRLLDYRAVLERGILDYIAITDHNSIETALEIRSSLGEHGDRIIIGEEIMTTRGEIIGLYLSQTIPAGLEPSAVVAAIRAQGGIVYIPHPFETVRSGLTAAALDAIAGAVDIMEVYNGRAIFQNRSTLAVAWASAHGSAPAASSDAHGRVGWGLTYSLISDHPTRQNLIGLLHSSSLVTRTVGAGIMYPKLNRLKKRVGHGAV